MCYENNIDRITQAQPAQKPRVGIFRDIQSITYEILHKNLHSAW